LVGKIRQIRVRRREKRAKKWITWYAILIDSFAQIAKPGAWAKTGLSRNPVRYTTLKRLGINERTLAFKPITTEDGSDQSAQRKGGHTGMSVTMEGKTGWFSDEEPEFDSVPAIFTRNDDGCLDFEFEYRGDGKWRGHLTPNGQLNALTGYATCPRFRATITLAFFHNCSSRRWLLVGEWVQEGVSYRWWTELIEVDASVDAQPGQVSA
jgi:hypothetical protein